MDGVCAMGVCGLDHAATLAEDATVLPLPKPHLEAGARRAHGGHGADPATPS